MIFSSTKDLVLCSSIIAKHSTILPEPDFNNTGKIFEHVFTFTLEGDVRKDFGGFGLYTNKDARGVGCCLPVAVSVLGFHEAAVGFECKVNVGGGVTGSNKGGLCGFMTGWDIKGGI